MSGIEQATIASLGYETGSNMELARRRLPFRLSPQVWSAAVIDVYKRQVRVCGEREFIGDALF